MSDPRILLISRPATGGAGRVVEMLLRHLPDHGITGTAALSGTEGTGLLEVAGEHGWDVRRVDMAREVRPLADLGAWWKLRRLVRGHDVVYAHTAKPGALGRSAAGARAPVVYAPHGFYFTYHPEGSRRFRKYLGFERRLASKTTLLHCVSEYESRLARDHGLATDANAIVIPNAAPPRTDADASSAGSLRHRKAIADDERIVLMAARLAAPKDPHTFLRAAARVPSELKPRFVLAGDGPLMGEAKDYCAYAPQPAPLLARHVNGVRGLLADAAVAVLCTASEALPTFLVEAMTEGVPVVATDHPACREACGEAAIYVPPGDSNAVGNAVSKLLATPHLHARYAAEARARASRFSEETWIASVVEMLRRAAAE